jgi:hypothetical protein
MMNKILIFICLWITGVSNLTAREYYFMAREDHFYENPANWFPAYPGAHITAEDKVIIYADAYFQGYNLEVDGICEVALGIVVRSADGTIVIRESGLVDNSGELFVSRIENFGRLYNRISAMIHIYDYMAYPGSFTCNFFSASFLALTSLVNEGHFDNYNWNTSPRLTLYATPAPVPPAPVRRGRSSVKQ